MFDIDALKQACDESMINIGSLTIEDIKPEELRDFAKEIFISHDSDVQADLICDFTHVTEYLPHNDEYANELYDWIGSTYEEQLTEFLYEHQAEYERDACESSVGSAW